MNCGMWVEFVNQVGVGLSNQSINIGKQKFSCQELRNEANQVGCWLKVSVDGWFAAYHVARIKTTRDVITTLDYNSVLVCFQEFIVERYLPLSVIHFSLPVLLDVQPLV
jgi:hypothetical protein